jgi:hypothetical protein
MQADNAMGMPLHRLGHLARNRSINVALLRNIDQGECTEGTNKFGQAGESAEIAGG